MCVCVFLWLSLTLFLALSFSPHPLLKSLWCVVSSLTLQNDNIGALQDLSAAIHMDPNNHKLFFRRGCLLRKYVLARTRAHTHTYQCWWYLYVSTSSFDRCHPLKALQDMSTSILLDSSARNVLAFFHRGIVYTQLNWSDFAEGWREGVYCIFGWREGVYLGGEWVCIWVGHGCVFGRKVGVYLGGEWVCIWVENGCMRTHMYVVRKELVFGEAL